MKHLNPKHGWLNALGAWSMILCFAGGIPWTILTTYEAYENLGAVAQAVHIIGALGLISFLLLSSLAKLVRMLTTAIKAKLVRDVQKGDP